MKLIRLSANQPTFKTVEFNPTGISLIVGKKRSEDKKKSYNSIGKSLTIAIVHFCLASNKIDAFEKKLPDWEFELEFQIDDVVYISRRNTSNQSRIFLNDEEMDYKKFRTLLAKEVFLITEPIKNLTFRTLISRFIRPYKSSYVSYDNFVNKEQDYGQLLNNAYLLGLDIVRIQRKFELKKEYDDAQNLKNRIEKDNVMRSYFDNTDEGDVDIQVVDLTTKIKKLNKNISEFKIAEDYNNIRLEADRISANLQEYKLKASSISNAIRSIDESLKIKPDISRDKIIKLYKNAQVQLGEAVLKRLEEVESFNEKILTNRGLRLAQERKRFSEQLKLTNQKIQQLSKLEDEKLQYLNSHGALDDYTQLTKQLSAYTIQLEKLQQFKNLLNEYKNKLEEVKKDFSKENIATNEYLKKDFDTIITENITTFQSLANEFYNDKPSGITVSNNEGKNKLRYNINAKIELDRGDGVNEVKIFCFDWTLLKGQHNHKVKFLFHDSRILSETDTRQVATMFKIAYENSTKYDFQYILSANQNILDALKEELTEEEYQKIIVESEVLELNDESVEGKLLGIQVDLDYEK